MIISETKLNNIKNTRDQVIPIVESIATISSASVSEDIDLEISALREIRKYAIHLIFLLRDI